MQYRQAPNSQLTLSALTLGTWQLADTDYWGDDGNPTETVRAALDLGITTFDCAEGYAGGESERVLGQALGADRDKAIIATKVSKRNLKPDAVIAACERSLERLGTDVIDLYQVHWPDWEIPFSDTYGALQKLQEQGKVREIGVSNFGSRDLGDWMAVGTAVTNQMCYHLLLRAIEFDIVPACEQHQIGILAYSPLMQGILSGRWKTIEEIPIQRRRTRHFAGNREGVNHGTDGCEAETMAALEAIAQVAKDLDVAMADLAIAWVLAKPQVTSVIVGGCKPEQVKRNARAVDVALDSDVVARLDLVTDKVKQIIGDSPDSWQGGQKRIR